MDERGTKAEASPAYLVVTGTVTDRARMQGYAQALVASGLYERHGGRYLFIGPAAEPLENWIDGTSIVCALFPSRAAAHAFWHDAQYQDHIKPLRAGAGDFTVAIFEGLPGG